jgi:hypothetical protein
MQFKLSSLLFLKAYGSLTSTFILGIEIARDTLYSSSFC